MKNTVLLFDNNTERYRDIAESYAEKGDYGKALSFLHTAYKKDRKNIELIADIADAYADAGLFELSNVYWFRYLDKAAEVKKAVAYGELAINYYYMNQPFVSGYYFHKKTEIAGVGVEDVLEEEVREGLKNTVEEMRAFRIVYPYSHADYSREAKEGKRAISLGEYKKAVELLSSIPKECPAYKDAWDDLSVALLLAGDIDEGIKVNRDKIREDGESVSAYCNLSSLYAQKKDFDKSAYYYEKAVLLPTVGVEDEYKLATCSLENGKHQTGAEYIKKILKDRPYDLNLRHLLGLALINTGDYVGAREQFAFVCRFDPENLVDGYYIGLCGELVKGGTAAGKLLPLKYEEDVPNAEFKLRFKKINKLAARLSAGKVSLSREDIELFKWGMDCPEDTVSKASTYVLCCARVKPATEFVFDKLIDPDFPDHLKRAAIYLLLLNGVKAKAGLVSNDVYLKIRLRVPDFGEDVGAAEMRAAYALCYSRMIFTGISDGDKLFDGAKAFYKKIKDKGVDVKGFSEEECALFIAIYAELELIPDGKSMLPLFSVSEQRYEELNDILR